jgi:integrase
MPFHQRKDLGFHLGREPVWFGPSPALARSGRKAEMSQRGWLTKEERKRAGKVWVYHYYRTRETDGHRVENTVVVGALSSLPREKDAWAEVEHRGLDRYHELGLTGRVMFGDLARHYIKYELGELAEADDQKSHTTIERYLQILNNRLIPRWGNRPALEVEPLEIMQWLKASKRMENLENPTVDKIRRVMNLVFKHGQTYGLIPRTGEANPMMFVRVKTQSEYEAKIITPEQCFKILMAMPQPERTLTMIIAATGLRISECLGLQWADVDYDNQQVFVRRSWTGGKVGKSKTAASKAPVPMVPLLAGFIRQWQEQTPYGQPPDWVFASTRLKGKRPRVANMLVEDYLRPAAVKAGVLKKGEKVRFGFHNLRHSLASFLVRKGTDVKTVQKMLRHSDVSTTLGIYAHSMSEDRLAAQDEMLAAMMTPSNAVN